GGGCGGCGRTVGEGGLRLGEAWGRGRARGARSILPHLGARQFQAAAALRLRQGDTEIARRQAPAPQARGGGVRARARGGVFRRKPAPDLCQPERSCRAGEGGCFEGGGRGGEGRGGSAWWRRPTSSAAACR